MGMSHCEDVLSPSSIGELCLVNLQRATIERKDAHKPMTVMYPSQEGCEVLEVWTRVG